MKLALILATTATQITIGGSTGISISTPPNVSTTISGCMIDSHGNVWNNAPNRCTVSTVYTPCVAVKYWRAMVQEAKEDYDAARARYLEAAYVHQHPPDYVFGPDFLEDEANGYVTRGDALMRIARQVWYCRP